MGDIKEENNTSIIIVEDETLENRLTHVKPTRKLISMMAADPNSPTVTINRFAPLSSPELTIHPTIDPTMQTIIPELDPTLDLSQEMPQNDGKVMGKMDNTREIITPLCTAVGTDKRPPQGYSPSAPKGSHTPPTTLSTGGVREEPQGNLPEEYIDNLERLMDRKYSGKGLDRYEVISNDQISKHLEKFDGIVQSLQLTIHQQRDMIESLQSKVNELESAFSARSEEIDSAYNLAHFYLVNIGGIPKPS